MYELIGTVVALWIVIAIVSALFKTTYATLQKSFSVEFTALDMGWLTATLGAVIFLPLAIWSLWVQQSVFTPTILLAMGLGGLIELIAMYTWLAALQTEDLSIVSPLRQTIPIFVVILEPILLSVPFDPGVALGAVLTVIGAYVVLVDGIDIWSPLTKVTERGPQLAIATAILFALASILGKFVLGSVQPLVYAEFVYITLAVGFILIFTQSTNSYPISAFYRPSILLLGVITALVTLTTFTALALSPSVSKVSVIFRASLLFNVIIGIVVFNEDGLISRFLGSLLIISGIAVALL